MEKSENNPRFTILNNQLGLEGKETINVVLNYLFVNAFFNIESKYDQNECFSIRREGNVTHKLHHITNADIATMIILQKVCDVRGKIADVTTADIVRALHRYFEQKYSETQVYISLKKFRLNKLIRSEWNEETGRYTIWLNHYIDPDTDKPGKLVIAHNFIFTKEFTALPVAIQKLYLSCVFRRFKEMQTFDLYDNKKSDVQRNNLLKFLHLSDTSQLRNLLHTTVNGKRLFFITTSNGDFKKAGGRYCVADFKLNKDWTEQEKNIGDGTHFHELIQPRFKYERPRKYLIKRANEKGIGEIEQHPQFFSVIRQLRQVSRKVKDIVLNKIKDDYVLNRKLPFNLLKFVKDVLAETRDNVVLLVAKQKKLQHFVRPIHLDDDTQARTEKRFLELMRRYPLSEIPKMFTAAQQEIAKSISSELATLRPINYDDALTDKQHELIHRFAYIRTAHSYAYNKRKSTTAYQRLITNFVSLLADKDNKLSLMDKRERTEWLFNEIDKLPSIKEAPAIIRTFDLSEFILKTFDLEQNSQLSHIALA